MSLILFKEKSTIQIHSDHFKSYKVNFSPLWPVSRIVEKIAEDRDIYSTAGFTLFIEETKKKVKLHFYFAIILSIS